MVSSSSRSDGSLGTDGVAGEGSVMRDHRRARDTWRNRRPDRAQEPVLAIERRQSAGSDAAFTRGYAGGPEPVLLQGWSRSPFGTNRRSGFVGGCVPIHAALGAMRRIPMRKKEVPEYSALVRVPNRGLPEELRVVEASKSYKASRDALEVSILEGPERPSLNESVFWSFIRPRRDGFITRELSEGAGKLLLLFTRPVRAADYAQIFLRNGPTFSYLQLTPVELLSTLRDAGMDWGLREYALDLCPRCGMTVTRECLSALDADYLVRLWCRYTATARSRAELYIGAAVTAARDRRLGRARDVLLEAVGHVTAEDARMHLLLGQLAVALEDRVLLEEARHFLRFCAPETWERRLDEIVRTGSPDYEWPTQ